MSKTILEGNKKSLSLNIKELLAYRDLFITLTHRDLKVRYAQTFLGFLWALLQPVITLLVLIMVFQKAIHINTDPIPYPLFALAGMCSWVYFSFVVTQAGSSLIGAQAMIHKIYFPRLILPLSKAVVGFVDFSIILFLFFLLLLIYKIPVSLTILYLPLFIIISTLTALAAGIWLSALTIRFRDFQIIIPYIIQLGLFITPVAYPIDKISEKYKFLFYLNPMTGVVEGFRWSLLGTNPPGLYNYISFSLSIILFITGLYYFKKVERVMADIL